MARLPGRLAIQIDQRHKPRGLASDDRQRERQPERPGAHDRLRRAADRHPHGQALLHRTGPHARVLSAGRYRPDQVTCALLAQLEQQLELLGVELVVVVEVVAEEGEGLDERAAPGHDLRAPAGEQVDLGEVLKDAHGIIRAEDGHGAR